LRPLAENAVLFSPRVHVASHGLLVFRQSSILHLALAAFLQQSRLKSVFLTLRHWNTGSRSFLMGFTLS
jgi:hypothetical protein